MAGLHSIRRTFAALFLLALAAALLSMLGRWQLHRADERRAIEASIQAGRSQPPVQLSAETAPAELRPWRNAQVRGRWLNALTVLVQNRNHDGRPGYWVATPLELAGPEKRAVLVLRGWVPRAMPGQAQTPPAPAPEGEQLVQGEIGLRVPRMFELWSLGNADQSALPDRLPAADGEWPQVQNLDLGAYARAAGIDLLPAVLQQTQPADDELVHDWPQPSIDYNQNQGYALQWFAFAAIAAIAFSVVLFRALRRRFGDNA